VSGGQFIVNITAELHLPLAFVGPAEKAIHLFGLIGNGMGIQAYNSGDWGYRPTAVETGDTGLQQWRLGIQTYNSGDWGYRPTAVETGDTGLQQWRLGIQAYSSGDATKRRDRPGDTTKRIYCFVDTMKLII